MDYIKRRIRRSDLKKEISFGDIKVVGDRLSLKVEEAPIPLEAGLKITFTKTLNYSLDSTVTIKQQTFEILSVDGDKIEIENPTPNTLYCTDIMEYSHYDNEMDGDGVKTFNYLTTEYNDSHYFVLTFANEHFIGENEEHVKLCIRKPYGDEELVIENVYFYKHFEENIDGNKLQISLSRDNYLSWGEILSTCKFNVMYDDDYDDRIFFKEQGEEVILSDNVTATVVSDFLNFKVHLNESQGTNLFQENLLRQEYVDDVINSAIPEINDYEKNIVKPYVIKNGNTFVKANKMVFNLHFRDRMNGDNVTEGWTINEGGYWNGEYKKNPDKSDLLDYLGFDEDDVYFQKMKLQKSFLRLSFYDSKEPMKQNLLFYSTIFMDSGELFGMYNKIKTKAIDGEISGVDGESNMLKVDEEGLRLDSQFVVTDKYNIDKSSEGFYIYLFNKTLPKKEPIPIYMKVEFNHAKYGKTIPFLYFKEGIRDSYLENGSIDIESYLNDLHIELEVKYDENTQSYMYYLPQYTNENNEIILNLFEPRING